MRKETPAVWLAGRMEMLCCGGVALSQEPPFPLWHEPWWLWEARQCLVAAWQIYILTIFVLWEPVIGLGQAVHAISIRSCVNKTCSEKLSCRELEWSLSEWRMLTSFNLLVSVVCTSAQLSRGVFPGTRTNWNGVYRLASIFSPCRCVAAGGKSLMLLQQIPNVTDQGLICIFSYLWCPIIYSFFWILKEMECGMFYKFSQSYSDHF